MACAASLASLDILLSDETQANIQRIADCHAAFISRLVHYAAATAIRQRGTILAFDLNTGESTSYFSNIRDYAYQFLLDRGVIMRPLGNVLYFMPPYCTTDDQLAYAYAQVEELLKTL